MLFSLLYQFFRSIKLWAFCSVLKEYGRNIKLLPQQSILLRYRFFLVSVSGKRVRKLAQSTQHDTPVLVKKLREMLDEVNPSCHLEVDGGVDLVTGVTCKENGANVLVAGSAFFGAADRAAFAKEIEL